MVFYGQNNSGSFRIELRCPFFHLTSFFLLSECIINTDLTVVHIFQSVNVTFQIIWYLGLISKGFLAFLCVREMHKDE